MNHNTIPVALFLWKRPSNTIKILEKIIEYGPEKLIIIMDGPRNAGDKLLIDEVLAVVNDSLQNSKFPILIDKAPSHYGLKKRFTSGFKYIFKNIEEEVIILEDDTIPSASFFHFAAYYLKSFSYDQRVIAINGSFRLKAGNKIDIELQQAFLTKIFCSWGWATWKSKFLPLYEADLKKPDLKQKINALSWLKNYDLFAKRYDVLDKILCGELDTWDVQLQWNIILNQKYVLIPAVNLIYNNGLDDVAATQKGNYHNLLFKEAHELTLENTKLIDTLKYIPQYDIQVYEAMSNHTFIAKAFYSLIAPHKILNKTLQKLKVLFKKIIDTIYLI